MFIIVVFVWLIIVSNARISHRPRESRLEKIRNLWAVMAFSFLIALIINALAYQLLPSGGCRQSVQPQIDCDTLYSIISAAQSYCMGVCPFMVVTSFIYLVQLVANILSAERTGKEKRKNEEL